MTTWPQWGVPDAPPYSVIGPVTDVVSQHIIEANYETSLTHIGTTIKWFNTQPQAAAYSKTLGGGGVNAGVAPAQKAITSTVTPVVNAGEDVLSWEQAIVDLEKRVTDPQWWLRVGEFAIGALLILAGVLRMTGVDPSKATGAIGLAAKVIK